MRFWGRCEFGGDGGGEFERVAGLVVVATKTGAFERRYGRRGCWLSK